MSTGVASTVHTITSYIDNNNTISAGSGESIFQASSAANVITKISGIYFTNGANAHLCIGPTDNSSPSSTDGTQSFNDPTLGLFGFRASGVSFNAKTAALNDIQRLSTGVSALVDDSSVGRVLFIFDNYIIPPGYYVYIYNTSLGSQTCSYQIHKITIQQGT